MKYPFLLEEKKRYIGDPAKQQNPGVEDETLRPSTSQKWNTNIKDGVTQEKISGKPVQR